MARRSRCQAAGCDGRVSVRFARVFGNQNNEIYECPQCSSMSRIKQGAAVSPDADGTKTVSVEQTDEDEEEIVLVEDLGPMPTNDTTDRDPAFAALLD